MRGRGRTAKVSEYSGSEGEVMQVMASESDGERK